MHTPLPRPFAARSFDDVLDHALADALDRIERAHPTALEHPDQFLDAVRPTIPAVEWDQLRVDVQPPANGTMTVVLSWPFTGPAEAFGYAPRRTWIGARVPACRPASQRLIVELTAPRITDTDVIRRAEDAERLLGAHLRALADELAEWVGKARLGIHAASRDRAYAIETADALRLSTAPPRRPSATSRGA